MENDAERKNTADLRSEENEGEQNRSTKGERRGTIQGRENERSSRVRESQYSARERDPGYVHTERESKHRKSQCSSCRERGSMRRVKAESHSAPDHH